MPPRVWKIGVIASGILAGLLSLQSYWRNHRVCNAWKHKNVIAVVTGGSRGVGKGIAVELGAAGATVYVLGRSRRGKEPQLPGQVLKGRALGGTIDDTAEEVSRRGGVGIPIECDASDDRCIQEAVNRIGEKHGRIDLLVNCAILIREDVKQTPPFWKQEIAVYDAYHDVGTRSAYVFCTFAMPYLLRSSLPHPLIVDISSPGGYMYLFNVAYGMCKCALDRFGKDANHDLRTQRTNVCIVTLHPGMVQTERMLAHKDAFKKKFGWDVTKGETPSFTGRAVCSLLSNQEKMMDRTGKVMTCCELAFADNFTDIDGSRGASFRMAVDYAMNRIKRALRREQSEF